MSEIVQVAVLRDEGRREKCRGISQGGAEAGQPGTYMMREIGVHYYHKISGAEL